MRCPNNEECEIEFYLETNDSGDPSTPYFSSWDVYVYDSEASQHVEGCPELTNEQILKLEEEYNSDAIYNSMEF